MPQSRVAPPSSPSSSPSPAHESLPEELLAAVAARFRVLGAPSRLRILDALMARPMGMTELGEATGLEASNLSRQLAELERAGCVTRTRVGREVKAGVSDPSLRQLCELVCGALRNQALRSAEALGATSPSPSAPPGAGQAARARNGA